VALLVEELSGDDDFSDVYARLYPRLVAYCRQLSRSDPEDLAQEALVRAWRAWPRYAGTQRMWPLVTTIARRISVDEYRRTARGHVRRHIEAQYCNTPPPCPEETLEASEQRATARRALAELPPRYQRMIQLRDLDERSYTDIAALEGTNITAARSTVRRARQALRAAYQRASEGLAAVVGVGGWAGRKIARLQAQVQPAAHQGLTTLAGAAMAIVVVTGFGGTPAGTSVAAGTPDSVAVTSRWGSTGSAASGADGVGAAHTGTGGGLTRGPGDVTPPGVPRADHVVGPVGVGGDDYGRHMTEDSEVRIELNVGDQVLVGLYANPSQIWEDPTAPVED
jgi:RNA polymerase sigma-70 factor (ECF subfamily)